MVIISHRGHWITEKEKNTETAFKRAFLGGYGLETDIRDHNEKIVISHDMPAGDCYTLEQLLRLYNKVKAQGVLALNVKADTLQGPLKLLLKKHKIKNYFVFDMSIPDAIVYIRQGFKVFQRQSEYEEKICFHKEARGIWLDEFDSHWISNKVIEGHIQGGKDVCIVSPELHGRPYEKAWKQYKTLKVKQARGKVFLCTDYPDEARRFFNE